MRRHVLLAHWHSDASGDEFQIFIGFAQEDAAAAPCENHTATSKPFDVPAGLRISLPCDKLHLARFAMVEDAVA